MKFIQRSAWHRYIDHLDRSSVMENTDLSDSSLFGDSVDELRRVAQVQVQEQVAIITTKPFQKFEINLCIKAIFRNKRSYELILSSYRTLILNRG